MTYRTYGITGRLTNNLFEAVRTVLSNRPKFCNQKNELTWKLAGAAIADCGGICHRKISRRALKFVKSECFLRLQSPKKQRRRKQQEKNGK